MSAASALASATEAFQSGGEVMSGGKAFLIG
jgi:hypothetical protein